MFKTIQDMSFSCFIIYFLVSLPKATSSLYPEIIFFNLIAQFD